ncbi:MAG: hypothetical protein FJY82_02040 [Candidatus Aminicenantes bacterium]|nr:hypothetical protein [Candidatus Aminicenantes bacterium]
MRLRTIVGVSCLLLTGLAPAAEKKDYPVTPVPFTDVRLTDAFWLPRIETNRTVTIPFLWKKNEETGRIDNFAVAGKLIEGKYGGERYNDTDVYKPLEGSAYSLMVHPDPALEAYLDGVIAKIAAAQEPDGYLFTPRTADPSRPQPGIGPERWSELAVSHELYNAGHIYEAAVAHFMATGKRTLLDVAVRNADLVAAVFGSRPGQRRGFPGHQEVELALVKLYWATGNEKYLSLAKFFLDQRGPDIKLTQYPPGNRLAIYNEPEQIQAHRPVLEQDEAVGHAVRVTYMASGMTDVAALFGDPAYLEASRRLWENVVGKKMYLTGGIGSGHDRERFGPAYELPNLTGYLETCASIGMAFWNHRMFLLTGDAHYLDVLERVVYNGVLAGVSLEGNSFFYANPLESDGRFKFNQDEIGRLPFFETACCPGNIARFLPSLPGYVFAVKGDILYVNLFAAGTAKVDLAGRAVTVTQETRYPWEGAVKLTLQSEAPGEFAVHVRVPGWARNRPVPTDLYHYLERGDAKVEIRINGKRADMNWDKGFARFRRRWRGGDTVEIIFPMDPRRVGAHEAVKDDAGKVAVERGPLVYCAEWPDNGGRALNLDLPDNTALLPEWRPDLLGGVVVIKGKGTADRAGRELTLIPYYAWAHRGPGEMAVWLPRQGPAESGNPRAKRVEGVFSRLISVGEPGAAVLAVKDGRVVFERGYGVAELRTLRPVGSRTNFRLASVSKPFTAAAVMLLVRDGRVSYETRLTDLFPDFPPYGREITIRRLLQHTSGLPDYEDLMPKADPAMPVEKLQIQDAGALDLLKRTSAPLFPPGTRGKYSNSGYVLLGLVVEKASGLPFGRFLRERIFAPLHMDRTVAYERGKNEVPDRAYGHGRRGDVWRETDQSPTSATLGDGGIYSSLEDLARWDEALRLGTLLGEVEMKPALTPAETPAAPVVGPDGMPHAYGFGWFLSPWKDRARMWHYGETIGFRTAVQRFPDDRLTVIVLANRSDLDAAALALQVADIYLER